MHRLKPNQALKLLSRVANWKRVGDEHRTICFRAPLGEFVLHLSADKSDEHFVINPGFWNSEFCLTVLYGKIEIFRRSVEADNIEGQPLDILERLMVKTWDQAIIPKIQAYVHRKDRERREFERQERAFRREVDQAFRKAVGR